MFAKSRKTKQIVYLCIILGDFWSKSNIFWCFDFWCFEKSHGALRDITVVPQGKNLRFIKKILKIASEEIIARIAKPRKLEFYLIFREIFVDSWCIMHDLDFLCFCKTTRSSAGYHGGSAEKFFEIYQKHSEDHKWGNHSSNSKTSEIGILNQIYTDLFTVLTYNGWFQTVGIFGKNTSWSRISQKFCCTKLWDLLKFIMRSHNMSKCRGLLV